MPITTTVLPTSRLTSLGLLVALEVALVRGSTGVWTPDECLNNSAKLVLPTWAWLIASHHWRCVAARAIANEAA